jgi:DNA polymerase I
LKQVFWLLDINHEVVDGSPEIRLWAIDESGAPILLRDRTYRPSFHLIPRENEKADEIIAKIAGQPSLKILDIQRVHSRLLGRPIEALKVEIEDPESIEDYAKSIAKKLESVQPLEADIRYSSKYMIDRGVLPARWNIAEVRRSDNMRGLGVSKVYDVVGETKPTDSESIPDLDLLAFSVTAGSEIGSPNPSRDAILAATVATSSDGPVQFIGDGTDDSNVIRQLVEYFKASDPDVVFGYGSSLVDWPYLIKRAEKSGIRLGVDRCGGAPHQSLFGHISVTGRAAIDLLDFAELIPEVKVKTLSNISKFIGTKSSESVQEIDELRVFSLWRNEGSRNTMLEMLRDRVKATLEVGRAFLNFGIEMAGLVSMPLDYVMASDVGHRVESYLMKRARSLGELIPSRKDRAYESYKGGFVLEPEPGLHRDIAVLDFTSMYPSLMIRYNISPDTFVRPDEEVPEGDVNTAPEVSHRFRKSPAGIYKEALADLIESRRRARLEMERSPKDSPLHRVLDSRQRALKVITNAMYGYAGWSPARWYMREVAEATAAWGRKAISDAIESARQLGLRVLYGDTDSVFIESDPKRVETLLQRVKIQTGIEIRVEKVYRTLLFTEAKKRYAGLTEEGSIEIVGLEFARGDWSDISRQAQQTALEVLLRGGTSEEAISHVEGLIIELRARKVPTESLIIWKTLTKPLEEYEVRAPHVEAARALARRGFRLTAGDKVGYLVVRGKGRLAERAVPYVLAKQEDVDIEYYVQGQILPAVHRVLAVFGVGEEQLRARLETALERGHPSLQKTLF